MDLDRLTGVEILQGGTKARVGGGATAIQVYEALESQNLSFVGGRVGSVGVGGFTLGGGTSPFSNKYGWSLDNVYEYEVGDNSDHLKVCLLIFWFRSFLPTEQSPLPPQRTTPTCILRSVAAETISASSRPSLFGPLPKVLSLPA